MRQVIRIERHELGPRVHLFGQRVHEYQAGFMILGASPALSLAWSVHLSIWTPVLALFGVWLVAKDWPDLRPATRDTASWRFGLHRLPPEPNVPRATGGGGRDS